MARIQTILGVWLAVSLAGIGLGQVRPLAIDQTRYTVVAGGRISLDGPPETVAFMKSAKRRTAHAANRDFAVSTELPGDRILLGVPLTAPPGDYPVLLSLQNDAGEERTAAIQITVKPLPAASSAVTPVVLLDGFQAEGCPQATDSSGTFGKLQTYLSQPPNSIPSQNIYFFENCTECPDCTIEQLGSDLATFLASQKNSDGTPVAQFDLIAHSMGGLIIRSYLSGKQTTSGAFTPPAVPLVRKVVFVATPHFGSYQADSALASLIFAGGNQASEMKPGSQFAWDLATWNQFGDDLRGVDAIAVIGNDGPSGQGDGLVYTTSASLDFVAPGRTRVIPYCHVDASSFSGLAGVFTGCTGAGIVDVESTLHPTYQIVSSFLLSTTGWQSIGTSPAQDPILAQDGGLMVADVGSNDQYVTPNSVNWGGTSLSAGAATELFYNDFVSGTGSFNFGSSTCGPFTETAGVYATVRCKAAPAIHSVGPLLPGAARSVQAGGAITINGMGFGAQCAACGVTAGSSALQVSSWSDTTIQAVLPASNAGLIVIAVTAASGHDAIGVMSAPASAAPAISLSASTLAFAYTIGGAATASQTVTLTNSGAVSLAYSAASNATWLTASVSGGVLTVTVNPATLVANTYLGAISLTAAGATNSPVTISVSLAVAGTVPAISIGAITHSATGLQGPVAPGELISIYGAGLGTASGLGFTVDPATGGVDTSLAGTTVLFGSVAAPILYASAKQINCIVPYEMAGQSQIAMQVQYQGATASQTLQTASASPGAYTVNESGAGPVVAANQNGSLNGPSNPAVKGSYVTIYFTGGGQTNPAGVTGSVTGSVLKWLTQAISVTVGNQPATVTFDGSAPSLVDGVDQLNIQLSPNTPSGAQPVVITIGGVSSPATVTLAVQ